MIKNLFSLFLLILSSSAFASEVLKVELLNNTHYNASITEDQEIVSVTLCDLNDCSFSVSFNEKTLETFYFKYLKARRKLNEMESLKGRFENWLFDEDPKKILAKEIRTVNAFDSLVVFIPLSIREDFLTKLGDVISDHEYSLHTDLYKNHISLSREGERVYLLEDFGYRAMSFYHKNKKDLRFMRSFESYTDYLKFHIELIKEEFLILNYELL